MAREVHKKAVQEERKDLDLGVMISITLMTYRCSKQKHFRAGLSVRLVKPTVYKPITSVRCASYYVQK